MNKREKASKLFARICSHIKLIEARTDFMPNDVENEDEWVDFLEKYIDKPLYEISSEEWMALIDYMF